jgi:hypothetical protein
MEREGQKDLKVQNGSKENKIPPGAWMFVLCLLYKDSSMDHKLHEEGQKDLKVQNGSKGNNGTGKKNPA